MPSSIPRSTEQWSSKLNESRSTAASTQLNFGYRYWHRNPRTRYSAAHRKILPRRQCALPRLGRHRTRPRNRQTHCAGAWSTIKDRKCSAQGHDGFGVAADSRGSIDIKIIFLCTAKLIAKPNGQRFGRSPNERGEFLPSISPQPDPCLNIIPPSH